MPKLLEQLEVAEEDLRRNGEAQLVTLSVSRCKELAALMREVMKTLKSSENADSGHHL